MKIESRGGTRSKCVASQFLRSPSDILHFERSTAPFPLTLTLSLRERSPRTLYALSTPEPGDVRRFLPLFPTQEGGEGWGEEEFFFWITPLSDSLPARASRGEREKKSLLKLRFMGREQHASRSEKPTVLECPPRLEGLTLSPRETRERDGVRGKHPPPPQGAELLALANGQCTQQSLA